MESIFNKKNLLKLFDEKLSKSRSKGIDKKNSFTYDRDIDTELIIRKVLNGNYKFSPYIELLKLKGRFKKPRVISIPTIRDRLVLLAIKEALHVFFPEAVNKSLPNNYIKEIWKFVNENRGSLYFTQLDIEKYYNTIDRKLLLKLLQERKIDDRLINLINQAISTPTVPVNIPKSKYNNYKTLEGCPQGLSISNVLAQIYLCSIDDVLNSKSVFYRRYVDDMLLFSNKRFTNRDLRIMKTNFKKINLSLNKDKTIRGNLNTRSFIFLGYKIQLSRVSISDKNVQNFIKRIAAKFTWYRNGIKNESSRPIWLRNDLERYKEVFIEELNEMITGSISKKRNYGWLFFFSAMNDLSLLFKLDKIINSFFKQEETFEFSPPSSLKRLVKAFYIISYPKESNKGYINNYDDNDTVKKKFDYLSFRGRIDPNVEYTEGEIVKLYNEFVKKKISSLKKDISYRYF